MSAAGIALILVLCWLAPYLLWGLAAFLRATWKLALAGMALAFIALHMI